MCCHGIVDKDNGIGRLEPWAILLVAVIGGVIGLIVMVYIIFGRVKKSAYPKSLKEQGKDVQSIADELADIVGRIGNDDQEIGEVEYEDGRDDEMMTVGKFKALCKDTQLNTEGERESTISSNIGVAAQILELLPKNDIRDELDACLNALREDRMVDLGAKIKSGAKAFLKKEYTVLSFFVVVMMIVVGFAAVRETQDADGNTFTPIFDWRTVIGFFLGAVLSGSCGYLGMWIATESNVRTAQVCWQKGLNSGLQLSFGSGAVMGLSVVCSGVLGLCLMVGAFMPTQNNWQDFNQGQTAYLAGFGFGASSIALFARVGGGIYTKAADVGADLVGKVEAGIPEDDPRNPACIADNVGDNVGDVAGMGADLFESFVGSIIASIQLAPTLLRPTTYSDADGTEGVIPASNEQRRADIAALVALPFWIAGWGILCSIIGIFLVRAKEDSKEEMEQEGYADKLQDKLLHAINFGIRMAGGASTILNFVTCGLFFGFNTAICYKIWGCTLLGLVAGLLIGNFTEYTTSFAFKPTRSIAKKARFGHAGPIIQGLGVGMISTVVPVIILFVTIIICYALGNVYGIAIAAVGMLSTLGVTLATDAFGPVADNAGGIAEMAYLPEEVRVTTDGLDSLGNTTAASGKGFAIGSAVLTALALLAAFKSDAGLTSIDISKSGVLASAIFGACLPYVFGALTMMAVGRAAGMMIKEVRDQFRGLNLLRWDPNAPVQQPDCDKCIAISTDASIKEMLIPGVLAIVSPLFIGYLLNAESLGGLLVGAITSGCMLAIYMANAGGAWDNAKKWIEAGGLEKAYKKPKKEAGKGSEWHKASVTGDTVGDPFKDTSGPALNILIKLMTMIALVFGATFTNQTNTDAGESFCAADGLYCLWWLGLIIGVVLMVFIIGFWCWMRKTGFGKVNFDTEEETTAPANEADPNDV